MPVCVVCERMRATVELTRRRQHGEWTCKDVASCAAHKSGPAEDGRMMASYAEVVRPDAGGVGGAST